MKSPSLPLSGSKQDRPKTTTSSASLSTHVGELASASAFMLFLAEAGGDRLTISQAAFFMLAAAGDARGRPLTMTDLMEDAKGIIGPSVANTYKVLLEPTKTHPIGLSWLKREPDPDDERRKYLRLTDKGRSVARAALLALGRSPYTQEQ